MTAEPRDVEEIRGAALALATQSAMGYEEALEALMRMAEWRSPAEAAAADRENAELRGEVERLRQGIGLAQQIKDWAIIDAERDDLRAQLAAAQAQLAAAEGEVGRTRALCDRYGIVSLDDALAELDGARIEADEARAELRREQDAMATLYGGFAAAAEARDNAEAQVLIQNGYTNRAATAAGVEQQRAEAAEAAEARLEAVRAASREELDQLLCDAHPESEGLSVGQVLDVVMPWLAALSAAPQPEPDDECAECTESGTRNCVAGCNPEPPASDEPTGRSD